MIVSRFYEDLSVLHDNHQYTNIRSLLIRLIYLMIYLVELM